MSTFGYSFHILLNITLAMHMACVSQVYQTKFTPSQRETQSPHMVKMKELWDERRKALDPRTKHYPKDKMDILLEILGNVPAEQINIEVERVLSSMTRYSNLSEYDQTLVQAFVLKFLHDNNREQLINTLSRKSPRSVASNAIELVLAIEKADNILVLFESYERAANEDARKTLLDALSSAFKTLRKEHQDNREFIDASKNWYLENRAVLKVNSYYYPRESSFSTRELFVRKNK